MEPQIVELPDGTRLEFPPGMSPEDMLAATKQYYSQQAPEQRATGDKPPEALTETAPGEFTGESGARYSDKPRQPQLVTDLEETNRLSPEGLPSVEDLRGNIFRNILGKEPPPSTPEPPPSQFGAAAQGVALSTLPTLAGYFGMRGGAGLGALTGPAAPVAVPALALTGGAGSALAAAEAQRQGLDALPEDFKARFGLSEEQIAASKEAYPYSFNAGALAPSLLAGRPISAGNMKLLQSALKEVNPALAARVFGQGIKEAVPVAALSAGVGGSMEAGGQLFDGDKNFDPVKIGQSAVVSGLTGYSPRNVTALERSLIGTQQPTAASDTLQAGTLRLGGEATPVDILPPDVVTNLASDVARVNPQAGRSLVAGAETRRGQMPGALSTTAESLPGVPPGATVAGIKDAASAARQARQDRIASGKTSIVQGAEAEQAAAKAATPEITEGAMPAITRGKAGEVVRDTLSAQKQADFDNYKALYAEAEAKGDVPISPKFERGEGAEVFDPVSGKSGTPQDLGPDATGVISQIADAAMGRRSTLPRTNIPKTEGVLSQLNPDNLTFRTLIDARQAFSTIRQGNADATEAAAARDAIAAIDSTLKDLTAAGRFGDSEAATAWSSANSAFSGFMSRWDDTFADRIVASDAPGASAAIFGGPDTLPGQTPNRVRDLADLRDRLGQDSAEWAAVQQEMLDRALSRDMGKGTFGTAFAKWERINPELAALLVPEGGRNALVRAQGEIKAATEASVAAKARGVRATERATTLMKRTEDAFKAKVEPASQGLNFMSTGALDFRNAVDGWTPSQRQAAKVGVRQAMRDAASKPDASIRLLADLADNTDAQANLRSLLGNAEADDIIRKAVAAKEVAKRIGALEQGARSGLGAAPTERDLSDIAPDVIVKSGPMGNKVELFDNFFQSVSRLLTAKGLSSAEALQVSRDLLDPEKADLVRDQLAKQIGEGPADAARRRAQAFYGPMAERLGIAATRAAVTQREPPPKAEAPAAPPAEEEKAEFISLTAPTPEAAITVASTMELPAERAAEIAAPIIANEQVEGTGDNPRSSAVGYGQFIDPTFIAYYRKAFPQEARGLSEQDILAKRGTGVERPMLLAYTQDNVGALVQNGMKLTLQNLYALHHMGAALGVELLRARPDQPAEQVLGADVVRANPQFSGMTAGQAVKWLASHAAKGVPITRPGAA